MPSFRGNEKQEVYEWVSNEDLINSASMLMGGIDLDPASSAFANEHVNAEYYYTPTDDGINGKEWFGNVYLFPPNFSYFWEAKNQKWKKTRGLSPTLVSGHALWWRILKRKWYTGEIKQGIYFSNCPDMVRYSQDIFDFPICFLRNTPTLIQHFPADNTTKRRNTCTSFVVYLQDRENPGESTENFVEIYSEKGRVIV